MRSAPHRVSKAEQRGALCPLTASMPLASQFDGVAWSRSGGALPTGLAAVLEPPLLHGFAPKDRHRPESRSEDSILSSLSRPVTKSALTPPSPVRPTHASFQTPSTPPTLPLFFRSLSFLDFGLITPTGPHSPPPAPLNPRTPPHPSSGFSRRCRARHR